jgi:hypothetical protein
MLISLYYRNQTDPRVISGKKGGSENQTALFDLATYYVLPVRTSTSMARITTR